MSGRGARAAADAARAGAATIVLLAVTLTPVQADPPSAGSLTLGSDPAEVTISPLPCDRRGEVELNMTNTGTDDRFVDALLSASSELDLDRGIWSTYVPADPHKIVTAPLTITASEGTGAGEYQADMTAEESSWEIAVNVVEPPGDDAGDNLALYRQAFASSIHQNTTLCGGVDGNTDSDLWADSGSHDSTDEHFPDVYGVELDHTYSISRVEVFTLDSEKYPAHEMGIRDFDIQVHDHDGWHTVATVEDNEQGQVTLEFPSVEADRVQVVTHDSNDHRFSRIIELEVYQE